MTDYTPTTEQVREAFAVHGAWKATPTRGSQVSNDAFDRWLAAHDREVAAKALREAARACAKAFDPGENSDWAALARDAIVETLNARADRLRAEREGAGEGGA